MRIYETWNGVEWTEIKLEDLPYSTHYIRIKESSIVINPLGVLKLTKEIYKVHDKNCPGNYQIIPDEFCTCKKELKVEEDARQTIKDV